jgi:glycosyltransferase involved in cell wall biosynthesis
MNSMFQSYINRYGRFPNYSVALHLSDLNCEFPKIDNNREITQGIVFYDVTQFVLGGPITGIQRVVNAFLEQSVCPVVFYNNNYYKFVENKIIPKNMYPLLTRIINFISKHTYVFFSNFNASPYLRIREYRKKLVLKNLNVDYKKPLSLMELEESNIFISDLPASREHLEFLLVLSNFTKSKISIFVHDLIPITFPELMPKNSTIEFNLYGKLLINVDRIFFSTEYVLSVYQNYKKMFTNFNLNQTTYVTSFPNFKKNLIDSKVRLYFSKTELNILDSDKPFILAVGTVFTRKNYSLVLRALKKIDNEKIQCRFVIAAHKNWGDSALNFAIKESADSKKNIFFIYGLSDAKLAKFYEKASLVVFPSLAEGFGLPIIEARSYGKVVLVNKIEPMLSFSKTDSGIIAIDPNSDAWAKMIEQILEGEYPINLMNVTNNSHSKYQNTLDWCSAIIEIIHNG